jgi:hypothetical protein
MTTEATAPGGDPNDGDQESTLEAERFTERGEEAEQAAFRDEGAYSGGDFAGGETTP